MPHNLSDAEEIRLLDLSLANGDLLALLTAQATESAAGTEVTGGSYAKAAVTTWGSATGSGKANSSAIAYTGLPTAEIQGWELFASDGTTRKWYGLFQQQVGSAQNSGDTVTITAHGLVLNQKIVFMAGHVPTPLVAGTIYFCRTILTNTFQVSLTAGGSAVAITVDNTSVVIGRVLSATAGDGLSISAGQVVCTLD